MDCLSNAGSDPYKQAVSKCRYPTLIALSMAATTVTTGGIGTVPVPRPMTGMLNHTPFEQIGRRVALEMFDPCQ